MFTEAEKSYNPLSASWRPREVHGVIQTQSPVLKSKAANHVHPRLRTGEGEMFQLNSNALSKLDDARPQWGSPLLY